MKKNILLFVETMSLAADVFVLTSLWEGFPFSLLEAMYMKKTYIVSDVIGNNNFIQSGYNGYVYSGVDDFVRAIKAIESEHKSKLTDMAYQNIVKEYNTTAMSEKHCEKYHHVSEKNGRNRLLPDNLISLHIAAGEAVAA